MRPFVALCMILPWVQAVCSLKCSDDVAVMSWFMHAGCFQHVQFKDRQREKQRQSTLRAKVAASDAAELSGRKRVSQKPQAPAVPKKLTAAKRRLLEVRQDADDMSNDYALFKKLKKGKLTEVSDCGHRHLTPFFAPRLPAQAHGPPLLKLRFQHWGVWTRCVAISRNDRGLQEAYDALTGLAEPASSEKRSPLEETMQHAAVAAAAEGAEATQSPPNGGRWRPQRHKLKRATKHKLKKQA